LEKGKEPIAVLVVYSGGQNPDFISVDTSLLTEQFYFESRIPRIIFAEAMCSVDGKPARHVVPRSTFKNQTNIVYHDDHMPPLRGGSFFFRYHSRGAVPNETNVPIKRVLDPVQLAIAYAQNWSSFSQRRLIRLLDKDFHYSSEGTFDEIPSRWEYLSDLDDWMKFLKYTLGVKASAAKNRVTGQTGVVLKYEDKTFLLKLKTANGRILSATKTLYDPQFEVLHKGQIELYAHNRHISSIFTADVFFDNILPDMMENGSLQAEIRAEYADCHDKPGKSAASVAYWMYGGVDVAMQCITARNSPRCKKKLVSSFPVMAGRTVWARIVKVLVWDNGLEATVFVVAGSFRFAFYATDYYLNRQRYRVGARLKVCLAALALTAEKGCESYQINNETVNYLRGFPSDDMDSDDDDYDYDSDTAMPSYVDLKGRSAVFPSIYGCPDELLFHTIIHSLKETAVLGVDMLRTDVAMCPVNEHDDTPFKVPLYFRRDLCPTAEVGAYIKGNLWLTGAIADNRNSMVLMGDSQIQLAEMACRFDRFLKSVDRDSLDDLETVREQLPLIKINEGYIFDFVKMIGEDGLYFKPYARKSKVRKFFVSSDKKHYVKDLLIESELSIHESILLHLPQVMSHFRMPFTEFGIMQTWLLFSYAFHWMNSDGKVFIFDAETLSTLLSESARPEVRRAKEKIAALNFEMLLPDVIVSDDHAVLRLTYWQNKVGLVQFNIAVERIKGYLVFKHTTEKMLVRFSGGV